MNTGFQNVFHHNLSHCRSPVICGGKPQRATGFGARTEQLCECQTTNDRDSTRSTSPDQPGVTEARRNPPRIPKNFEAGQDTDLPHNRQTAFTAD
jgi:hypothetical protein